MRDHFPKLRVAITGATGFLGSHLAHALVMHGSRVVALKRSTSDCRRLAGILKDIETCDLDVGGLDGALRGRHLDAVIHCATDYGRKPCSRASMIESNLLLPLRLMELASRSEVRMFINTDTLLDKRVSDYTLSKRQFREWLHTLHGSTQGINVALEHFYGGGDDATKFVTQMIRRLAFGSEPVQLTAGAQVRDFIHIDDVVAAFLTILSAHARDTDSANSRRGIAEYEVGTGSGFSIRQFMELLQRLVQRPEVLLLFGALPYRDNEVMHSIVDAAALRALGWTPKISLEEGLARTLAQEIRSTLEGNSCGYS